MTAALLLALLAVNIAGFGYIWLRDRRKAAHKRANDITNLHLTAPATLVDSPHHGGPLQRRARRNHA